MSNEVKKSTTAVKGREKLSRREFGKIALGLGAFTASGMGLALKAEENFQANRERYAIKKINGVMQWKIDRKKFKRFHAKNIAFNTHPREIGVNRMKAMSANTIQNMNEGKYHPKIKANSVADARAALALSNAAWTIKKMSPMTENEGFFTGEPYKIPKPLLKKPDEKDPKKLTVQTKLASRLFGADVVGIAPINRDWVYSGCQKNYNSEKAPDEREIVFADVDKVIETDTTITVPNSVNNVVVVGFEQNREILQTSPSMMSLSAVAMGYSRMTSHDLMLAEFIRGLGYIAIPCSNTWTLSVPMAVEAGLGEAGRSGTLISPEYGANLRLSKVLTNMPLMPDQPIEFGVQQFCETCKKCARECPSKSITEGPKSWEARNECSMDGVYKWQNDFKKCVQYWTENGTPCSNCIATCPFTKGAIWVHDGVEFVIDKMRFMDPVMLGLDDAFAYGERRNEEDVWNMSIGTYGLDSNHHKNAIEKGKFPL